MRRMNRLGQLRRRSGSETSGRKTGSCFALAFLVVLLLPQRPMAQERVDSLANGWALRSAAARSLDQSAGARGNAPPHEPNVSRDEPEPVVRRHVVHVDIGYVSRFDTNVDHNLEGQESFGFIPALEGYYQSTAVDPLLRFYVTLARHNYTGTDRWDRWSQRLVGILEPDREGRFRMETSAEASFGGSDVDRDLSDQFELQQQLEYRLTGRQRFELYGSVGWQQYADDQPIAFRPRIGLDFKNYFSYGGRLEFGVRFERKEISRVTSKYHRWRLSAEYRQRVSSTSDLFLSFDNYIKNYDVKDVEVDGVDVLRQDRTYRYAAGWSWWASERLRLTGIYRFEKEASNDPEEPFEAHLVDVGLLYRL